MTGAGGRARMLRLQAEAEERLVARSVQSRQSVTAEQQMRGMLEAGRVGPRDVMPGPIRYVFEADREVAEARLGEWSDPVCLKFEEGRDGHLELWMRVVDGGS